MLAFANKFHFFSDSSLIEHGIYKEVHNSFVFYRFLFTDNHSCDKNPEAAYVEKSEDDEISISIVSDTKIRRIGIINGFVKTPNLYASNNRIGKIDINHKLFELKDMHSKDFVFFDIPLSSDIYIQTVELYKGTKYSDTCIAEIQVE